MKPIAQRLSTKTQRGIIGIFLSALLSAALVVAGAQGTQKANMNAYHTGNKSSIEEANQLMLSGLRYANSIILNTNQLTALMNQYQANTKVVMVCSQTQPIPDTLVPTEVVADMWTPNKNQEIRLKAVFAPYDCNQPLSNSNFRGAFEVIGGSGCKGSSAQNSELCATRAVVVSAFKGNVFSNVVAPPVVVDNSSSSSGSSSSGSSSSGSSSSGSSSNSSSSSDTSSSSSSSGTSNYDYSNYDYSNSSSSSGSSSSGSSSSGSSSSGSSSSSSSSKDSSDDSTTIKVGVITITITKNRKVVGI